MRCSCPSSPLIYTPSSSGGCCRRHLSVIRVVHAQMPKTGAYWSNEEDARLTELVNDASIGFSWVAVAESLMATPLLSAYYCRMPDCVRGGDTCRQRCARHPRRPSLPTCRQPPTDPAHSHPPFPRWEWRRWENKLSPDAWKHGTPWSEQEIELLLQLVAPYPDDKIPWKDIAKHIEGRSAAWSKSAPGTA